jgi:hypothetical protein
MQNSQQIMGVLLITLRQVLRFHYGFLMFNTISGNIIENDEGVFFDKQNDIKYKEALPQFSI